MEPRRDDIDLAGELRALRPAPRPEFAAELDARAAAGFLQRQGRGRFSAFARFGRPFRSTPSRRLLAPAGALALTAIAIATAVISISEEEHGASLTSPTSRNTESVAPSSSGSGLNRLSEPSAPASEAPAAGDSSGAQFSESPPYASKARRRDVERSAQIVLGADPSEVRGDAAKVFDAVHAVNGIVLRSSIRDGAAGEAGAEFELMIPSGKVGDALAAFSTIAEVRSRRESTRDITAPTVGAGEKLRDSRARIESLLAQLAKATTEGERTAVEAELRVERRHSAALRSRLTDLRRRANFSRVWLRIETGERSDAGSAGGAWGVTDGLDDAGHILGIAAGVTIVALAVIAPLALIGLLVWFGYRAWVRRARAQALV